MTTLLRRLARPADPARQVRPVAALPYQAAPAFEDPPPLEHSPLAVSVPGPSTPLAAVTPSRVHADEASAAQHVQPPRSSESVPDVAKRSTPPPRQDIRTEDRPLDWRPPEPLMDTMAPPQPARQAAPMDPTSRQEASATIATGSEPAPAQAGTTHRFGAPMTTASQAMPAPLFPSQPKASGRTPAPTTPGADAGRTERHAPADEPNEVHVHIGRIEVTAVTETPAPKSRRRQGKTPMSLDDYLARKRGDAA